MENVKNSQNVSVNSDSLNHGLNEFRPEIQKFIDDIDYLLFEFRSLVKLSEDSFLESPEKTFDYIDLANAYRQCYTRLHTVRFNNFGFKLLDSERSDHE